MHRPNEPVTLPNLYRMEEDVLARVLKRSDIVVALGLRARQNLALRPEQIFAIRWHPAHPDMPPGSKHGRIRTAGKSN
jgi:hypothetical protein